MHFPWQARCKRHANQRCWEVRALISWERLHFGASHLQFSDDDLWWFCVTGAAPRMTWPHFFVADAVLDWKRIGTRPLALHTTFYFWRKSRRIASFLMLNLGSLAEFLRFWPCQVQKLRKSRSIAAFLMLPGSKAEEVSQNSFVFKLADR